MPPSALYQLVNLHMEYPMLFELRNPSAEKVTHCGVLEFTADEGMICIPNWMMENMHLKEGDTVNMRSASLVKGNFVKLQPHTKDFLDISNPKAMLETSLRNYSCLTTGDTIMIAYNNKKYYIDVVETKPSPAVSIIETDCEVDFAQPLDYEEPEKQLPPAELEDEDVPAAKKSRIIPFSGSARRLDGKPSTQSVEQTPSSTLKQQQQTANAIKSSNRASGKLVFGSNANTPKTQTQPKASLESTSQESPQKVEEPKFQAFSGKKYTLS
ncbi:uncharacterized protein LOC130740573 [Lotus japonicus]|uniref:uncharacterized protein LOC130740573 n=1 Tax=Lotus japonicus TaxID=34305 RepID=UPI00258C9EB2|nr:uncharacterized protein LOC130740573 [Lotus japonicus]XP_057449208.1 uncharacterized protein LOC130740573 [Lotus japonicus]